MTLHTLHTLHMPLKTMTYKNLMLHKCLHTLHSLAFRGVVA